MFDPTYTLSSAFTEALAPLLLVIGVVMIGFLILMSVRGKIARRNRAAPTPREHIEHLKSAHQSREDINVIKSDMYTTAQTLSSQLAVHARHLEILIDQADQRIAALARLGDNPPSSPAISSPDPAPSPEPPVSPAPPHFPPSPSTATSPPTRPSIGADPLSQSIYQLADTGFSAVDIAQQLDEQVGKVELILALRAH